MVVKRSQRLVDLWGFDWPIIDVLVGGRSPIDLKDIHISGPEAATEFLRCYGFDPDDPRDRRRLHALLVEAIAFLERHLLPEEWAEGLRPPEDIQLCDDPRHLLVLAGSRKPEDRRRRAWACAILRIMHTIVHLGETQHLDHIEQAFGEIKTRFSRFIHSEQGGPLWFGTDENRIALDRVEWKSCKSRDSIILKLLQKPGNIAENIYDVVGVRFVTQRLCDVMQVVKALQELFVISFATINPARAHNTLIDIDNFQGQIETLTDMLKAESISPERFESMLARMTCPKVKTTRAVPKDNPHSAVSYRSVQMTCRQLVRFPNPMARLSERLGELASRDGHTPETRKLLAEIATLAADTPGPDGDIDQISFFPFEVQVMDVAAYIHNQFGDAAHDRYKRSQVRAARRRVLGDLLHLRPGAV